MQHYNTPPVFLSMPDKQKLVLFQDWFLICPSRFKHTNVVNPEQASYFIVPLYQSPELSVCTPQLFYLVQELYVALDEIID